MLIKHFLKNLRLSRKSRQETASGEIINLMETNTLSFVNFSEYMHSFWATILQIIFSFLILYSKMGLSAFFGLIITFSYIPLHMLIYFTKSKKLYSEIFAMKDNRIKKLKEIFSEIKVTSFFC